MVAGAVAKAVCIILVFLFVKSKVLPRNDNSVSAGKKKKKIFTLYYIVMVLNNDKGNNHIYYINI